MTTFMAPVHNGRLGLLFYADGESPVSTQLVFPGLVLPAAVPFGGDLDTTLPLVPSIPEAPDASLVHLTTTLGPATSPTTNTSGATRSPTTPAASCCHAPVREEASDSPRSSRSTMAAMPGPTRRWPARTSRAAAAVGLVRRALSTDELLGLARPRHAKACSMSTMDPLRAPAGTEPAPP